MPNDRLLSMCKCMHRSWRSTTESVSLYAEASMPTCLRSGAPVDWLHALLLCMLHEIPELDIISDT